MRDPNRRIFIGIGLHFAQLAKRLKLTWKLRRNSG
jgi:hypothetical protein